MITFAALLGAFPIPPAPAGPRVCIEPPVVVVVRDGPTSSAPFCIDGSDDPRCRLTSQPAVPAPQVPASPSWQLRPVSSFAVPPPTWLVGELAWSYAGRERAGFPRSLERPPRVSL